MELFINKVVCLSPYEETGSPEEKVADEVSRLYAIEPDYTQTLSPNQVRRMAKSGKMGLYASTACLQGHSKPDAIIVGTGQGGFEYAEKFLQSFLKNEQKILSPTPFLQSLHNSLAGQLAINLDCTGYNMTYANRGFSFENSLLDAGLLLKAKDAGQVLVGGMDELSEVYADLMQESPSGNRAVLGEGATFLLASSDPRQSVGAIEHVATLLEPSKALLTERLEELLSQSGLSTAAIDVVISGQPASGPPDELLSGLEEDYFEQHPKFYFKKCCGEFATAAGFAVWASTEMFAGKLLDKTDEYKKEQAPERILILNQYLGKYYTMILVSNVK